MKQNQVAFGTSGVRGLVVEMTDSICYHYTQAFLTYLQETKQWHSGQAVVIGGDLRSSTPRIMSACAKACLDMGAVVINAGHVPSPAVALYGFEQKIPSLMVTGSHIPDDRNGIKFNTPTSEILKADEEGIVRQIVTLPDDIFDSEGMLRHAETLPPVTALVLESYQNRYIKTFQSMITGLRVGVYQHSSVGRDVMVDILESLGVNTIALGRAETFIPVDTEAIREEDVILAQNWAKEYQLDAIVSTDGDADRPLVSDETGRWLRGDILGILCARYLNCSHIVTPVSSNTAAEKSQWFQKIVRSKIGSPYVIQAMNVLLAEGHVGVCGYEANGGFLLSSPISVENYVLSALPTRDAVIVMLSILAMAKATNVKISNLATALPERYTFSDRVKQFPTALSQRKLKELCPEGDMKKQCELLTEVFLTISGRVVDVNQIDGVRMTFENNDIIHLRPSGNAPELRCYTEASTESQARIINQQTMLKLKTWLN